MTDNKCGSCTACCRVYAIPTLAKPAGKWCQHCEIGKGCKVYEDRPAVCSDFACLWLQSHHRGTPFDLELRPDRCKVVFSPTTNDNIMAAITMPGMSNAWMKGPARKLIDRLVAGGTRVVVGGPGTTHKTMIDQRGERTVTLSEPDETGMQWGDG